MSAQEVPARCRACGGSQFVDSGAAHWEILRHLEAGTSKNQSVHGRLVACVQCGLVETFLADPGALLASGWREVTLTVAAGNRDGAAASSDWQVVLTHAGPTPIGLIATLRQELPLDLATARGALKTLPWILTRTSNRRVADSLCEKLLALGAAVHVEPA